MSIEPGVWEFAATISILQVFLWHIDRELFGPILLSIVNGVYGRSIFSFVRDLHADFLVASQLHITTISVRKDSCQYVARICYCFHSDCHSYRNNIYHSLVLIFIPLIASKTEHIFIVVILSFSSIENF